jgi:hypothetical protein
MAVKKNDRGKIAGRVGIFNIFRQLTFTGSGKDRRPSGAQYVIYNTKHKLKDGFLTFEAAAEFAASAKYNRKTKSLVE